MNDPKNYVIPTMLRLAENISRKRHGGHWGILSCSNHYKAAFDTPDIRSGLTNEHIRKMVGPQTIEGAVAALIRDQPEFLPLTAPKICRRLSKSLVL